MTIEINAFDTLFFKDSKPFSMGEDVWASGIFPPAPSVFYGMIQSTYAAENNIAPKDILDATRNLVINSIFLKLNDDLLLPFPADTFAVDEKQVAFHLQKAQRLQVRNNQLSSSLSGKGFPKILHANTHKKIKDYFGKAFLTMESYNEYANGSNEIYFYKLNDFLSLEAKVGIGKELATNTTSEGKFYRVGMIRPATIAGNGQRYKLSFVINFEGIKLSDESKLLRLGAEYKAAFFNSIKKPQIPIPEIKSEYLCMYLSTPALFKNGSIPDFLNSKNFEGIDLELISCAIGKPVYLGGFDMVKRYPKPMRRAVPAGSVYYLRSKQANLLAQKLHNTSISEFDCSKIGFGNVLIGSLNI